MLCLRGGRVPKYGERGAPRPQRFARSRLRSCHDQDQVGAFADRSGRRVADSRNQAAGPGPAGEPLRRLDGQSRAERGAVARYPRQACDLGRVLTPLQERASGKRRRRCAQPHDQEPRPEVHAAAAADLGAGEQHHADVSLRRGRATLPPAPVAEGADGKGVGALELTVQRSSDTLAENRAAAAFAGCRTARPHVIATIFKTWKGAGRRLIVAEPNRPGFDAGVRTTASSVPFATLATFTKPVMTMPATIRP